LLTAHILLRGSDESWIWALVGAAAGVYLFFRGFRMLQRKRLILNTPSSKIRSASMGLVEVSGLAVGPYTMAAPITSLPCYYYRTMAWQWKQSGKNREWVKVADESLHLLFYLDDNTGRVLVNPQGAELDIHRDFHEEYSDSLFSSKDFVPPNVSSFLSRYGVNNEKKIKVEEYCIKPKNALFILGTLAENPGVEVSSTPVRTVMGLTAGLKLNAPGLVEDRIESVLSGLPGVTSTTSTSTFTTVIPSGNDHQKPGLQPEIIKLTSENGSPATSLSMTQQQKIAAALTKAGITNPAAWAAAGLPQAAAPAVQTASTSGAPDDSQEFDLKPKVVLMNGTHDPAFFISWRSQRDVVASLGWKSALYIWGGPALTLLCAYIVAMHFDLL
jgi:E3 Ubiquitin ligase